MPVSTAMRDKLAAGKLSRINILRGEDIFAKNDYPRDFSGFVGQVEALEHITDNIASARGRSDRLDHTLLACGIPGVGKTTIAHIMAAVAGVGLACISGPVDVNKARPILMSMTDGDILFWDEIHLAVAGNRNRADWLLPLMTDGVLMTDRGAEEIPNITIVGATTDSGKLPATILNRFMVQPIMEAYSDHEGTLIAANLSVRMDVPVEVEDCIAIARAASNNPRNMRSILVNFRDLMYARGADASLDLALKRSGFTADGLSRVATDILLLLLLSNDYTASRESIAAQLNEPGPLGHHEQLLLQKGLMEVGTRGRRLTEDGAERALALANERN